MTEEKTPAEICGGLSALKEEKWKQKGKNMAMKGNDKNQMFLLWKDRRPGKKTDCRSKRHLYL